MSPVSITVVPGEASTAQRATNLAQRARQEAAAASEEAFVLAEKAALRLWEVGQLELAPPGVRDGARRLAQQINEDVARMSALANRARGA